jgi:hypothetical protein
MHIIMADKILQQVSYEAELIGLALSIVQDHQARLSRNSEDTDLIATQAIYIMHEVEKYELNGEMCASVFQSASNLFANFCAQYQDDDHRFLWGTMDDELRRVASEASY